MTISSSTRKAGPYTGNGSTTAFPFSFKVFTIADLQVVRTDLSGIETTLVLGTDYTVSLNSNQNSNPGGTVNMTTAPMSGFLLTLTSSIGYTQNLDLTNQGGFYPTTINDALDRLVIQTQQVAEQVGRSVKVNISSSVTPDQLINTVISSAASATTAATNAASSATSAANSATSASTSASAASSSATTATTQASAATTQASNAATSATTATTQAGIATNSATTATTQATAAASSATSAAGSASAASTSATNAASSATNATSSASSASASAASAASSAANAAASAAANNGLFRKTDPTIVAWTKTGNGTATTSSILYVEVNGVSKTIASGTSITMPTLVSGTDYAIWVKPDGGIEATSNHTSPPVANAHKSGGFHYGPGGHSGSPGGGNSTPQINAYSFWDLKFRPACPDPRGMALVADGFWSDIYLLGVDHLTNGTSKYNVTIADGSSPPKIPTKFGGNGTNAYGSLTWWEALEVLRSHGKRAPTYSEFAALAFGTTEASSIGTDPGSTTWNASYISKWGMAQSTGNLYVWGDEFGGGAAAAGWTANTGGRGSTYQMENAVIFGGAWDSASNSGSRASLWSASPTLSGNNIGVRGVCDHLILD